MSRSPLTIVIVVAATLFVVACPSTSEQPSSSNLGDSALAHPRFAWDSVPSTRFTLYMQRGGYAAARASQYRDEVEAGIAHALTMLGEPRYPAHLRVFVLGSREDVEAVTGFGSNAQWQAEGALLSLDTLVNAFYQQDDLAACLQSGSLVQYLLETYGNERLRLLWRDGPDAFERAYGRSASQVEAEWHAWLRATPASARPLSVALARSEDHCPPRRK